MSSFHDIFGKRAVKSPLDVTKSGPAATYKDGCAKEESDAEAQSAAAERHPDRAAPAARLFRRGAGGRERRHPGLVTQYEAGVKRIPSRERVDTFAAVMGYEPEEVGAVLFGITQAAVPPQPGALSPVDPTPEERRLLREVASRLA